MALTTNSSISARVMAAFAAFGLPADQSVSYTILLQKNRIFGHCYQWRGVRAVIPVGGDTIDFYDQEHRLLQTVLLGGESHVRKAA